MTQPVFVATAYQVHFPWVVMDEATQLNLPFAAEDTVQTRLKTLLGLFKYTFTVAPLNGVPNAVTTPLSVSVDVVTVPPFGGGGCRATNN